MTDKTHCLTSGMSGFLLNSDDITLGLASCFDFDVSAESDVLILLTRGVDSESESIAVTSKSYKNAGAYYSKISIYSAITISDKKTNECMPGNRKIHSVNNI